ncbi:MBL fold metallo-hydrolase [Azospirillum sp. TSO22-1]|uniref:MBL fold metallo-hydrolase n=1 Tax=Azospirillum sp. TSO22-1 TaxID=716789 RepID=UPI000D606C44|nr:MBL fold metallo-hydrolase [Azospirillum sp. TSO22-1]PWC32024.1 hypothetical protein TSO221_31845 [Azospirillum sp. TSO22-1]
MAKVLSVLLLLLFGVPLFAYGAFADCLPVADLPRPGVMLANLRVAQAPSAGTVRVSFLGHASFLIETPGGVSAVTDYNDLFRPAATPDVVTMNNAHVTHYTDFPDSDVRHVLRGWDPGGRMAQHDIEVKDLRVRNVPTNVRDFAGTRVAGNSIFVFEVAGLCIAHLGHLHHDLTDLHLKELGMIDVLMVPVDGSFTIAQEVMQRVIGQIGPAVVIPMHWFSEQRLARFLDMMRPTYTVEVRASPSALFSRATLPRRTVIVLPGGH